MRLFSKLRKLNQDGFDHVVMGMLFVVAFGVLGTGYIIMTHAATQSDYIYNGNGKCIDNAGNRKVPGNPIQIYDCNKTDGEVWKINATSVRAGTIVNANGYCMTVPRSRKSERTYILLENCHNAPGQLWKVNSANHTITNPNSGLCLDNRWSHDVNGNPLWIYQCNGTIAQEWLPKAIAQPVQGPTVNITASPATVTAGSAATLTWSSKYAIRCTAGGGWAGTLPTSGSQSTAKLTQATTYTISCVGSQGSASAQTTVQVTSGGGGGGGGSSAGESIISTLYAYPTLSSWSQVINSSPTVKYAIVNICAPDGSGSGCGRPADEANPAWLPTLANLKKSGITPLYYISTNYGAVPLTVLESEIRNAVTWYATPAPMFDTVSVGATCNNGSSPIPCVTYYSDLYKYAVSAGAAAVEYNPGTIPPSSYMFGSKEIMQVYEGTASGFERSSFPTWMAQYPSREFAATLSAGTGATVGVDVSDATNYHIGNIYEDNEAEPPNYSTLPSFWSTEIADVKNAK